MTEGAAAPSVDITRDRVEVGEHMLLMIAVLFLVLWLLGLVALPAAGTIVHVLLIIAVLAVVMHFFGGRRSVTQS